MKRGGPLQRRTPMSRGSGFKRQAPVAFVRAERPAVELKPLARPPNYAMSTTVAAPVAKRSYVRSPTLREAYRLIPCQHCGVSDGTVCCAHSNLAIHGKGRSIKASDEFGASLCYACHTALDQGKDMPKHERAAMWLEAHVKSVALLVKLGHWPKHIAPPGLTNADLGLQSSCDVGSAMRGGR